MKQTWTMRVYKRDRRTKSGERLVSTSVWKDRTLEGMEREMRELACDLYPGTDWRFEYDPTHCVVKSLMTGEDVTIRTEDRGGPCDPSMERYWSM